MAMRPELTTDPEAVIAVSGPCVRKEGMKRDKLIWSWTAKTLQISRVSSVKCHFKEFDVHVDDQLG